MSPAPHEPIGPIPLRLKILFIWIGIYAVVATYLNGGIGP